MRTTSAAIWRTGPAGQGCCKPKQQRCAPEQRACARLNVMLSAIVDIWVNTFVSESTGSMAASCRPLQEVHVVPCSACRAWVDAELAGCTSITVQGPLHCALDALRYLACTVRAGALCTMLYSALLITQWHPAGLYTQ